MAHRSVYSWLQSTSRPGASRSSIPVSANPLSEPPDEGVLLHHTDHAQLEGDVEVKDRLGGVVLLQVEQAGDVDGQREDRYGRRCHVVHGELTS